MPLSPPPPSVGVPLKVMSSITGDKPLDLFLSTKEEGERLLHTAVTQYTGELSTKGTDKPQLPQGLYSEVGLHIGMERNFAVHNADPIAEVKLLISPFLG
jgi:hypothetical protein